jgi:hypothetical protein
MNERNAQVPMPLIPVRPKVKWHQNPVVRWTVALSFLAVMALVCGSFMVSVFG